jgi:hypothetical protein
MSATVINVTTEELRSLVDNLVEEKLISLFGDPEEVLEIRKELKERFLKQRNQMRDGVNSVSFDEAKAKLGLDE